MKQKRKNLQIASRRHTTGKRILKSKPKDKDLINKIVNQEPNLDIGYKNALIKLLQRNLFLEKEKKEYIRKNEDLELLSKKNTKLNKSLNGGILKNYHILDFFDENICEHERDEMLGEYHREMIKPLNVNINCMFSDEFRNMYKDDFYVIHILYAFFNHRFRRNFLRDKTPKPLLPVMKVPIVFGIDKKKLDFVRLGKWKKRYEALKKAYIKDPTHKGVMIKFDEKLYYNFRGLLRPFLWECGKTLCEKYFKKKGLDWGHNQDVKKFVEEYDTRTGYFKKRTTKRLRKFNRALRNEENRVVLFNTKIFTKPNIV